MTPHRTAAAIALLLLLAPAAGSAQTVRVIFVGPVDSIVNTFGADNVLGGYADGYRGVVLTPANLALFQKVAPPNLVNTNRQLQPGAVVRRRIDEILQLSGGVVDVDILLTDDRTGFPGWTGPFLSRAQGGSGKLYVWPAAFNRPKKDGSDRHEGFILLGETASVDIQQKWPGGWLGWEQTILHETLHTQFVGEKTKWGSIAITYGADEQHWTSELIGDQELPFEEGLGTFYGVVHNNPAGVNAELQFLSRTDERYAQESWSVLVGSLGNIPHRSVQTTPPPTAKQQGEYAIYYFRWQDVPGFYLLFSESTSTAFHLLFWRHANRNPDQALGMINASARDMWQDRHRRYLMYAVNRLSLQLEDFAATPQGQAAKTAKTLTSSMFPFALLDVVTHFGMTEEKYKQEYGRKYPDRQPQAYTQYWARREAVKNLVQAHLAANPIRMDQAVAAINAYFQAPDTILATAAPAPAPAP